MEPHTLLINVPQVCRHWRDVCKDHVTPDFNLSRLINKKTGHIDRFISADADDDVNQFLTENELCAIVARFHSWQSICVDNCSSLTDRALVKMVSLSTRYASLCHCEGLTVASILGMVCQSTNLVSLDLSGVIFSNLGSSHQNAIHILPAIASNLTALSRLSLCNWESLSGIKNQENNCTMKFPSLSELDLSGCSNLEGGMLARILQYCPKLASLDLQGCYKLAGAYLWSSYCSALQNLSLEDCRQITEVDSLCIVEKCPRLRSLHVTGSCFETENLRMTDTVCARIASLQWLSELHIGGGACTHVSDSGLQKMAKMDQLTFLSLYDCQNITAAGLAKASGGFPMLRSLEMTYYNRISSIVCDIPSSVTYLGLCGCENLTDRDLSKIAAGLPKIIFLDLTECGRVTEFGISLFQFADRQVEIVQADNF
jgi:hypothetical protein